MNGKLSIAEFLENADAYREPEVKEPEKVSEALYRIYGELNELCPCRYMDDNDMCICEYAHRLSVLGNIYKENGE